MSKRNIQNRDHYTIAGRERPGKNVIHDNKNHVPRHGKSGSQPASKSFIPGAAAREKGDREK